MLKLALLFVALVLHSSTTHAQRKSSDTPAWAETSTSAFKWRNVGPATTSGRIADLAVNPNNTAEMYIALASGGVWKTTNNGTTWDAVLENEGT